MSDQLGRADLPWERADYGAERTYETIKKPFSVRFAYWAGRNGKTLFQTHRLDNASASAFAQGWQDLQDSQNQDKENL